MVNNIIMANNIIMVKMNNGHVSKTNHIEKTLVVIIRVLVFTRHTNITQDRPV